METKIATVFVLILAAACGMIVDQEYRNPNIYDQDERGTHYDYNATPVTTNSKVDKHKYQDNQYENSHPKYEFKYAVNDERTGDMKSHYEIRDGNNVKGMYTLLDADGYQRIVEYTADKKHGFRATVRREPVHQHDQQYVKYTNDHKSRNNNVIYNPTVPTVDKYAPIESYMNHNSVSNKYRSKYVTAAPKPKYVTEAEIKYVPAHEVKYASAPEIKYVTAAPEYNYATEAPEIKYGTSAPEYQYVTEGPDYKYATEAPQYKSEAPQYAQYTTNRPQYEYVTEAPQYVYGTEAPQYKYTFETPQYKYVTQKPESQYVTVPYHYVRTASVERKPQKSAKSYYNYSDAAKAQEYQPSQEYNYNNQEFVYGH